MYKIIICIWNKADQKKLFDAISAWPYGMVSMGEKENSPMTWESGDGAIKTKRQAIEHMEFLNCLASATFGKPTMPAIVLDSTGNPIL